MDGVLEYLLYLIVILIFSVTRTFDTSSFDDLSCEGNVKPFVNSLSNEVDVEGNSLCTLNGPSKKIKHF